MDSSSFTIDRSEKLFEVLQGEYPSSRNNYFVLLDKLEKASSAFYQEVNDNLRLIDRERCRSYFTWLCFELSVLKVSYDPELLKMELMRYSEDPDSFPGYTSPDLIRQLETNVCLQKMQWGSLAEQEAMEDALMLQELFVSHLYRRKISEIWEYLERTLVSLEPVVYTSSRKLAEGRGGYGVLCWN